MRVMKLILIFRGSDRKWLYHGPKWQSLKKPLECFRNTNMAIMTNSYNFGGSKSDQIGSAFGLEQSWTPRCQEVPPTASHWRSPWRSHGAACHGKSRIKRNSDHSHPVVQRCPKHAGASSTPAAFPILPPPRCVWSEQQIWTEAPGPRLILATPQLQNKTLIQELF